jgi:hypothetical protein
VARLDAGEYQLVLADPALDSPDAASQLLAYARQKEYRPATALISSSLSEAEELATDSTNEAARMVRISNEDVSHLLDRVAALIGSRAERRIRQSLRRTN